MAVQETDIQGFTESDFETFAIDGFDERMSALRERLSPKLAALGEELAQDLSKETGLEFHHHVATHARRRVNPADDTWVALGRSERGYKKYAHLAVGLELAGVYVRLQLKPESEDKDRFAGALAAEGLELLDRVDNPGVVYWYSIHDRMRGTGPQRLPLTDLDEEQALSSAEVLQEKKSAEVVIGVELPRDEASLADGNELLAAVQQACRRLMPLYEAAVPA